MALTEEVQRHKISLQTQPNVRIITPEEVRPAAESCASRTTFGNYNWVSTVKNRSGALTVHLGSPEVATAASTTRKRDISRSAAQTLRLVSSYLAKAPLLRVDCRIGDNERFSPHCSMYVSVYRSEMARLAHKVSRTFFPARPGAEPELTLIHLPEWQEKDRQILVFPELGVTYILGTDYYGEATNAILRMAMWNAKQNGMLGLHAGAKVVRARDTAGRVRRLGMLLFGIAGTGKTTHTCHDHGLDAPGEGIDILQDEAAFWCPDGSALGAQRAFYIKTEGLSPETQPLLYSAATRQPSMLDNVLVDFEGRVHFDDRTLTANGRAIIQREDLDGAAGPSIDLPPAEELDALVMLFMSRNFTVVPVASKLTAEQAAVAFMLSQSLDITGAEAREAMAAARDGAANPYLVGDPARDVNRFYELLKAVEHKTQCFMLNTGGVGELVDYGLDGTRRVQRKVRRISVADMASVIRGIVRDTTQWREDPNWMVQTPLSVEGIDVSELDASNYYDQRKIDSLVATMRKERAAYAQQFAGLDSAVRGAVEF